MVLVGPTVRFRHRRFASKPTFQNIHSQAVGAARSEKELAAAARAMAAAAAEAAAVAAVVAGEVAASVVAAVEAAALV